MGTSKKRKKRTEAEDDDFQRPIAVRRPTRSVLPSTKKPKSLVKAEKAYENRGLKYETRATVQQGEPEAKLLDGLLSASKEIPPITRQLCYQLFIIAAGEARNADESLKDAYANFKQSISNFDESKFRS
ncbi:hypothetical protein DFQ28_002654 [Apophysomyces sp. BC1034]|nr:hypothetical protein DFQ30_003234 [Apophysomyces sp. BC1015]KAG0189988.1 hypothetical protein DFQ28_002654 [Apophysomyces sp. BC1034]